MGGRKGWGNQCLFIQDFRDTYVGIIISIILIIIFNIIIVIVILRDTCKCLKRILSSTDIHLSRNASNASTDDEERALCSTRALVKRFHLSDRVEYIMRLEMCRTQPRNYNTNKWPLIAPYSPL